MIRSDSDEHYENRVNLGLIRIKMLFPRELYSNHVPPVLLINQGSPHCTLANPLLTLNLRQVVTLNSSLEFIWQMMINKLSF